MIGINGGSSWGAGIGFAIPVDSVLRIVTGLLSIERIDRLGTGSCAEHVAQGTIESVHSQSPAEAIGMRGGDIILRVGDKSVTSQLDIERHSSVERPERSLQSPSHEKVVKKNLTLTLVKARKQKVSASERSWDQLGLRLAPAVPSTVQQLQPVSRWPSCSGSSFGSGRQGNPTWRHSCRTSHLGNSQA